MEARRNLAFFSMIERLTGAHNTSYGQLRQDLNRASPRVVASSMAAATPVHTADDRRRSKPLELVADGAPAHAELGGYFPLKGAPGPHISNDH
jgi:hypothetical protein